ncbi:response regulator transcription factor [Nitrogeniibacter mangrovi]|uniref:Response regulator transcription factor n=1 Tax=Nitrogeniibacter mangrovi TaxID=2016596 RepID=A0A6C1B9J0_9RHOO|nr:response regulator transcription factor [Nitrogeniibacter mangrovi]QID19505.1 response regulator transcription factor [Nitrogeniibacter mangrovi]
MLHIAIVDDHEIVRTGIREMLADELDIRVAFEADSGEAALDQLRDTPCDVLLLDLALSGCSGGEVLRVVRQRFDTVRVLVLSTFPEERYAPAMIRHGADGYLCKECDRDELIGAIRTIAQGRRYISPRTAELLAGELAGDAPRLRHSQLSERELEVFLRLARGESVSDIGEALNLSIKTVSTYRTRVLDKLAVSSNAELATYAIHHGLIIG